MKYKYTILFFLFFSFSFGQSNSSSKVIWGDTITRKIAPPIKKLIGSTDDRAYFTSAVRAPNIQDIITFDENNNIIKVEMYYKMHVIKDIIKFDDEHVYLVSLKKEKGSFKYYFSKFNLKDGSFGQLFSFNKIEEKTASLRVYASYKLLGVRDNYGWSFSPNKEKLVSVMSIGDKKETGILKFRIAYFNKDLGQTDTKIIETKKNDINNNIESFAYLGNGDVVILVNEFKNRATVKIDKNDYWGDLKRTPIIYRITQEGKVSSIELENEAFSNQRLINSGEDDFYYVARDKETIYMHKFSGDLEEERSESYIGPTSESSDLKIRTTKDKIYLVFQNWDWDSKLVYDSNKGTYYEKRFKRYGDFNCLLFNKEDGKNELAEVYQSLGGVSVGLINDELYCGFKRKGEGAMLMRIDNNGTASTFTIPLIQIGKRSSRPFFKALSNRVFYTASSYSKVLGFGTIHRYGSFKIDNIK